MSFPHKTFRVRGIVNSYVTINKESDSLNCGSVSWIVFNTSIAWSDDFRDMLGLLFARYEAFYAT